MPRGRGKMSEEDWLRGFYESYVPEPMSGCFLWLRALDTHGYAQIMKNARPLLAHRVSWTVHKGPIPPGMWVLHKCDNPACINPDHLFLGGCIENTIDRQKKLRPSHTRGKGVLYGTTRRKNGRYKSLVHFRRHCYCFGTYDTAQEAHEAALVGREGLWREAGITP